MSGYRVVIPTFQASKHLAELLPALTVQGVEPSSILVVDSSSSDSTVPQFKNFGAEVIVVPQSEFNHGGTRRMAALHCQHSSHIIFLTQDAIPQPGAFEGILRAFDNQRIGMAYGRQLPRTSAAAIERHARLRNYPGNASEVRQLDDRERLGSKTIFSSNSFAAYRTSALNEVGSFPQESFFGEDQITAGRLLLAGWSLAYVSDAAVIHSHRYTIIDDFKRYFDVGVFHHRNAWLLEAFGKAEGEGLRFVKSELGYLLRNEPFSIPSAFARTWLKYLGYRLGKLEDRLSPRLKRALSMAPYYWRDSK